MLRDLEVREIFDGDQFCHQLAAVHILQASIGITGRGQESVS